MPEITGSQIKDESITGDDIKDGSIKLADLSVEVKSQMAGTSSWKTPVAHVSDLPLIASTGDIIITLDTMSIWVYNNGWKDILGNVLSVG